MRSRSSHLLRISTFGLVATGFLLASDALPWALDLVGRADAITFLDALLMPAMLLFCLLFIWGLVEKFGR